MLISIQRSPASKSFYERKRAQGKRDGQAVLALARRRVNVLWAMLRDDPPYEEGQPLTALSVWQTALRIRQSRQIGLLSAKDRDYQARPEALETRIPDLGDTPLAERRGVSDGGLRLITSRRSSSVGGGCQRSSRI